VSLQLEALWDECYTDADIQNALANMPKDLSETYDRCLTRISRQHNRFAQKILPWVCVAIRPFKVSQLREALATDCVTGCLNQDNMPSVQELLKCCSNLIIRDCNDQVLLAHYSVRQFLEDRTLDARLFPTGLELSAAGLELGMLCVAHLTSPNYTLAVQLSNVRKGSKVNVNPVIETVIGNLGANIPYLGRLGLAKARPVRIPWPPKTSRSTPDWEPPSFFHFAKEQWAPLTRGIAKHSNCWGKFRTLAVEPNLSWRLHPWEPLGESLDSHFSGLLGWAIVNHHLPLLDLLFGLQNPKPRADIFNLPFYHYSNLPPLHLASRIGDAESTQRLLQVCNPKQIDDTRRTALHHAAETGHTDVALLLFKKRANLKAKDDKGQTALHLAAGNGHEVVVRELVKLGAGVNAKDGDGRTALFMAARNGYETTVRALVELNADVNVKDNDGRTALYIAAIRVLAKLGADVNAKDDVERMALFLAAENGRTAVVKLLLELGADVNSKDIGRQTALSRAAESGRNAVVKLLLELSADVNAKDDAGRTALFMAAESGHDAVVKLLLAAEGIDVNFKDIDGWTALSLAAGRGHDAVIKLLLTAEGIDVNSKDIDGWTALSWAAGRGHDVVVKLLLAAEGIDVNSEGGYRGMTALSRAAERGYDAVVKLLLAAEDIDVNSKDTGGRTALSWAVGSGHDAVIKLLLAAENIDVNSKDTGGWTALSRATKNGHNAVIKLLLAAEEISINSKDIGGWTRYRGRRDTAGKRAQRDIQAVTTL
jgi:ankyrin repeat protein